MAALLWYLSALILATAEAAVALDGAERQPVDRSIDERTTDCSEIVTEEGIITSPNYPENYESGLSCVIEIEAPECHSVSITFDAFELHERDPLPCDDHNCCSQDFLEINTGGSIYGDYILCGNDIGVGKSFVSSSNEMILNFQTETSDHSGWSADVTFVPIDGCTRSAPDAKALAKGTPIETRQTYGCTEEYYSSTSSYWMSPLFGIEFYENNELCYLSRSSSEPSWAILQLNTFELEGPSYCPYDWVNFTQPFSSSELRLCGIQSGEQILLPSYNFDATFRTDYSVTFAGFNITITQQTSNCHQLIQTGGLRSRGIIKAPKRNNNVWTNKACEWWIRAPEGNQIKLRFLRMKLSNNCTTSSVIVNRYGDRLYPTSDSEQYCETIPPPMIFSTGNEMNVLFSSTMSRYRFKAKWIVV